MDDDLNIDDISLNNKRKKQIKSSSKGKRAERDIVNLLNNRFKSLLITNSDWGYFSRSIGSGNRSGQVMHLPKHAQETFAGDLVCPKSFKFTIESKFGYQEVDFNTNKNKYLSNFFEQAENDSNKVNKKPILFYRKPHKVIWCFLKEEELKGFKFRVYYGYDGWLATSWEELSLLDDSFFFNLENT